MDGSEFGEGLLMDLDELRGLDVQGLREKLNQLKKELFHSRSQLAFGRIENPMRIRHTKRDIAQVKTILRQKNTAQL